MTQLAQTWKQVELLLSQGLSLIPVRDKPTIYNGKEYPAKTPYSGWKKYQQQQIDIKDLWHQMSEQFDTNAVAIIGGKVSGNLEIIDIDVKNWPGIDAKLFHEIELLYPELRKILRIHKSPSGGYHIFYKVSSGIIPGNKKLARKAEQKEAAIETRGEGGYVLAPPSMGYSIWQDMPIPTITWEERCSIIAICEAFNEVIKTQSFKASQTEDKYYSTNPFEDFNLSSEAEGVLCANGWTESGRSNRFIWFTRPDKGKGVSASFNLQKRVFYIFTSSTEFDPDRGYNPATALSILQHGGDKKKTFLYLTQKGYGKVRASVEKQIVEKNTRLGKPLPKNFSDEAKKEAEDLTKWLDDLHPHGVFWKRNDEGDMKISREMVYSVAQQLGYRYNEGNLVRIVKQFIYKVTERQFQDALKAYINEPSEDEYMDVADAYEAFMQRNGSFTMKRLKILDQSLILKDTKNICIKFFTNGYLAITQGSIDFLEYDSVPDSLIWHEKVQPRDYNLKSGGKYIDYLNKALVCPKDAANIIGYLSHEYKDETTGFIIVLTEQCPDPKQGGGSGKNVFCNLLNYTTTYTSKPGVQAKMDEKFFQSWNGQRIFGISDVPKNFDFSFLKEPSTGSFIWKKLFKDEVEVSNENAPKFIVQTNFSYEITDGGLKRRIIPLEFSDFFTRCGGLDVHYNAHFPNDWTIEDWGGFDTYIAESVQGWLNTGRKLKPTELTDNGWEKQFQHTYGANCADFINSNWDEWMILDNGFISNEKFKAQLQSFYSDNDIPVKFHMATKRLYDAIKEFCAKRKWVFIIDQMGYDGPLRAKGKLFKPEAPF